MRYETCFFFNHTLCGVGLNHIYRLRNRSADSSERSNPIIHDHNQQQYHEEPNSVDGCAE